MTGLALTKLHGLGNDFLVVLDEGDGAPVGDAVARSLCERHTGIGADGLILGRVDGDDPTRVVMTLWNADGSVAEISGNGLRCLAHAVARRFGRDVLELVVDTAAGTRRVAVTDGTSITATVRAEMGTVTVEDRDATAEVREVVDGAGRVALASVGNPHVVVEVPDPSLVDLVVAGPAVEERLGPINAEFVAVDAPGRRVDLTVWERGVGITRACGSGAVAAATVAGRWSGLAGEVTVTMPGGTVGVIPGDPAVLVGPSVVVADIVVPLATSEDTGDG